MSKSFRAFKTAVKVIVELNRIATAILAVIGTILLVYIVTLSHLPISSLNPAQIGSGILEISTRIAPYFPLWLLQWTPIPVIVTLAASITNAIFSAFAKEGINMNWEAEDWNDLVPAIWRPYLF